MVDFLDSECVGVCLMQSLKFLRIPAICNFESRSNVNFACVTGLAGSEEIDTHQGVVLQSQR